MEATTTNNLKKRDRGEIGKHEASERQTSGVAGRKIIKAKRHMKD